MKRKRLLDSDGEEVTAGCYVSFSYGIPPVFVLAQIIERDDELIALTPGHNPVEEKARLLKRYVGEFYLHAGPNCLKSAPARADQSGEKNDG